MTCNPLTPSGAVDCVTGAVGAITSPVTGAIGDAASSAASSAFDNFVQSMVDSANWAIEKLMTLWLSTPDPKVTGVDSTAVWINAHVAYLVGATIVATIIYNGIRLAIYSRSSDAVNLAETLVRTILVSTLSGFVITTGLQVSDSWAHWIIDQSHLDMSATTLEAGVIGAQGVLLILALLVIITQVVQLAIMIARTAVVVILAGTITWAAATSGTQMGRQWYQRSISWLLAFIIYKPVAALIYAVAFKMASGTDLMSVLAGIFLMVLSVLALPALMRLIMPATAAVGGANAGAIAGAAVGAGIAMGAMALTGGASAGLSGAGGLAAGSGGSMGGGAATGLGQGPSGAGTSGASPSTVGGSRGAGGAGGAGGGTNGLGASIDPAGSGDGPSGAGTDASSVVGGGSSSAAGVGEAGAASSPDAAPLTASGGGGSSAASGAGSAGARFAAGDALRGVQTGRSVSEGIQSAADETAEGGPSGATS